MSVKAIRAFAALAFVVSCSGSGDDAKEAAPADTFDTTTALTDTNPDPNVVEVEFVAAPATVEYLAGMFFQVLGPDGKPDPKLGWKDTVNVKRGTKLRFAVRYETPGM